MSTEVISPHTQTEAERGEVVSRRWFLLKLGFLFNGVVGAVMAVPVLFTTPIRLSSAPLS